MLFFKKVFPNLKLKNKHLQNTLKQLKNSVKGLKLTLLKSRCFPRTSFLIIPLYWTANFFIEQVNVVQVQYLIYCTLFTVDLVSL